MISMKATRKTNLFGTVKTDNGALRKWAASNTENILDSSG